jgi:hypothetical protein
MNYKDQSNGVSVSTDIRACDIGDNNGDVYQDMVLALSKLLKYNHSDDDNDKNNDDGNNNDNDNNNIDEKIDNMYPNVLMNTQRTLFELLSVLIKPDCHKNRNSFNSSPRNHRNGLKTVNNGLWLKLLCQCNDLKSLPCLSAFLFFSLSVNICGNDNNNDNKNGNNDYNDNDDNDNNNTNNYNNNNKDYNDYNNDYNDNGSINHTPKYDISNSSYSFSLVLLMIEVVYHRSSISTTQNHQNEVKTVDNCENELWSIILHTLYTYRREQSRSGTDDDNNDDDNYDNDGSNNDYNDDNDNSLNKVAYLIGQVLLMWSTLNIPMDHFEVRVIRMSETDKNDKSETDKKNKGETDKDSNRGETAEKSGNGCIYGKFGHESHILISALRKLLLEWRKNPDVRAVSTDIDISDDDVKTFLRKIFILKFSNKFYLRILKT